MNWYQKHLIDLKGLDPEIADLKRLISENESKADSMEYNQWLSVMAALHNRLNNRYNEIGG